MLFAAGEIEQGEGKLLVLDHSKVHLDAGLQSYAALGLALGEDVLDLRVGDEFFHQRRGVALQAGQDVDVADRLLAAPQAAGDRGADHLGVLFDEGQELGRLPPGDVEEEAARGLLQHLDALEDVLLGLGAEALQVQQAVLLAGVLELAQVVQVELLVEDLGLLGAEAGDLQELEDARRDRAAQLQQIGALPLLHHLGDFFREARADALDILDLAGGDQVGWVLGQTLQDAGGVLVGADLEGVSPWISSSSPISSRAAMISRLSMILL